jgi:hypothetical protein
VIYVSVRAVEAILGSRSRALLYPNLSYSSSSFSKSSGTSSRWIFSSIAITFLSDNLDTSSQTMRGVRAVDPCLEFELHLGCLHAFDLLCWRFTPDTFIR